MRAPYQREHLKCQRYLALFKRCPKKVLLRCEGEFVLGDLKIIKRTLLVFFGLQLPSLETFGVVWQPSKQWLCSNPDNTVIAREDIAKV